MREHGAKFCFFEMIDANFMVHCKASNTDMLQTTAKDRPIAAQLLGSDPDIMLKAAENLLKRVKPEFIDINSACPVKKVTSKGAGASLLRTPQKIYKIVEKLSKLPVPLTVKMRIGYEEKNLKHILAIAKNIEKAGAAALFVHGRIRTHAYSGEIDYEFIREIKEAVGIPVFGSGNVFTPQLAKKMFDLTKCDGILVARGAFGNPWIFKQIESYLKNGEVLPLPPFEERLKVAKKHLSYILKYQGEQVGLMRKVGIWYLKSFPEAAKKRAAITSQNSYEELIAFLDSLI